MRQPASSLLAVAAALISCGHATREPAQPAGRRSHGASASRPARPTPLKNPIIAVAAGGWHTCAVTRAGAAACWGWNRYGQRGDGSTDSVSAPRPIAHLGKRVASISPGQWSHTCAVATDRTVSCWGWNHAHQLGTREKEQLTPRPVPGLTDVSRLAGGFSHTCALTRAGAVRCWGSNRTYQLGPAMRMAGYYPEPVTVPVKEVLTLAAGVIHTCVLSKAGEVRCWGHNASGELGDGTRTSRAAPQPVKTLSGGVANISAGWFHTCALTRAGAVKCWGSNRAGQVGGAGDQVVTEPRDARGLKNRAVAVATGAGHTCALLKGGQVRCWGDNRFGQLGTKDCVDSAVPRKVRLLDRKAVAITAGWAHTCALLETGTVRCWGDNRHGQLGDGAALKPGGQRCAPCPQTCRPCPKPGPCPGPPPCPTCPPPCPVMRCTCPEIPSCPRWKACPCPSRRCPPQPAPRCPPCKKAPSHPCPSVMCEPCQRPQPCPQEGRPCPPCPRDRTPAEIRKVQGL